MHLAHDLVELKVEFVFHDLVELQVEFVFWSVVLGDLKIQLCRAPYVVIVLGARAHHRARAPPKKGRRKMGTRYDVDAIIIRVKSWVARPRATEEWLNRHGFSCQKLGRVPGCGQTIYEWDK